MEFLVVLHYLEEIKNDRKPCLKSEKIISIEKKLKKMSREEHNKMAMIDNLVWEVAKILIPSSFIEPKKVAEAKSNLIKSLTE